MLLACHGMPVLFFCLKWSMMGAMVFFHCGHVYQDKRENRYFSTSVLTNVEPSGIEYIRFPRLWNQSKKIRVGHAPRVSIGVSGMLGLILSASICN
jgi:hypothetical protein